MNLYKWRYAWYVVKHIFKVWRNGGPIYHDWSKFSPSEFGPYADQWFSGKYSKENPAPGWQKALEHHLYTNKHHVEYWGWRPIPIKYVREIVADWRAMGDPGAFYSTRGREFIRKFTPGTWERLGDLIYGR